MLSEIIKFTAGRKQTRFSTQPQNSELMTRRDTAAFWGFVS